MEGNPYAAMAAAIQRSAYEDIQPLFRFGKVTGISPLSVMVSGNNTTKLQKNSDIPYLETGNTVLLADTGGCNFVVLCRVDE